MKYKEVSKLLFTVSVATLASTATGCGCAREEDAISVEAATIVEDPIVTESEVVTPTATPTPEVTATPTPEATATPTPRAVAELDAVEDTVEIDESELAPSDSSTNNKYSQYDDIDVLDLMYRLCGLKPGKITDHEYDMMDLPEMKVPKPSREMTTDEWLKYWGLDNSNNSGNTDNRDANGVSIVNDNNSHTDCDGGDCYNCNCRDCGDCGADCGTIVPVNPSNNCFF